MKIANWDEDTKTLYFLQKSRAQDFFATQEEMVKESYEKGKTEAEIVGDIQRVLDAFEFNISIDKLTGRLKHIKDGVLDKLINYINNGHKEDEPKNIGIALELFGDRDAIDSEETAVELSGSSIEE